MARWTAPLLALLLAAPGCGYLPYFGIDDIHEELMVAARRGDVDVIAAIATKGVDLDQPYQNDRSGLTPLQHAIQKGRVDAVRVLLEWGANPDATHGSNKPPAVMAVEANNQAILTLLVNAGATPTDASGEKRASSAPSRP
jgi:ankyrin repeat protein